MADDHSGTLPPATLIPPAPGLPSAHADELRGGVHQVAAGGRIDIAGARLVQGTIAIEPNGAWIMEESGEWRRLLDWLCQSIPALPNGSRIVGKLPVVGADGQMYQIDVTQINDVLAVAAPETLIFIHEVTMALPNVICVTIREPGFTRRTLEHTGSAPIAANPGDQITYNGLRGYAVGPGRNYFRPVDVPPTEFLSRTAIKAADAYHSIGGRTVNNVWIKAHPYETGWEQDGNGGVAYFGVFEFEVFLELSAPLPQGAHVIRWPFNMLPDTSFTFDDKVTRCHAVHTTHNGHALNDVSKLGFLSLWLPRQYYGAIALPEYGGSTFHLIDANGDSVYTGDITLRMGTHEVEIGIGTWWDGRGYYYDQIGNVDHALGGWTRPTAKRIRIPFSNAPEVGTPINIKKRFSEFDASIWYAEVVAVGSTWFEVEGIDGEDAPVSFASNATWRVGMNANRAFTNVYNLDYSAFSPAVAGTYRVWIPGLGVSDPIAFNDGVWRESARLSNIGLYHHRIGVALDGRFGYTRPPTLRPNIDVPMYYTRVPYIFGYNGGEWSWDTIDMPASGSAPYLTSTPVPATLYGGHMDAGDWDASRASGIEKDAFILDVFSMIAPARRNYKFGIPASTSQLDPVLYAGTDSLPDIIHEILFSLDWYRRMQLPDGGVPGGMEFNGGPRYGEPSWITSLTAYIHAKDHKSSFMYSAAAAKMAIILNQYGHTALADVYQTSAIAAFADGEAGIADPDAYYADFVSVATAQGYFATRSWEDIKIPLAEIGLSPRVSAAAALARLTGDETYMIMVEAFLGGYVEWLDPFAPSVLLHYSQTAGCDEGLVAGSTTGFAGVVDAYYLTSATCYPQLKHRHAPIGWGLGVVPTYREMLSCCILHHLSGDPKYLKAMMDCHHHVLGANQMGKSLMVGKGFRTAANPLHEDSRAMGWPAPAGITIYGWSERMYYFQDWLWCWDWSPMSEVNTNASRARTRNIEPTRMELPIYESLFLHPAFVNMQEYTMHQSMGPMWCIAAYLDGQI